MLKYRIIFLFFLKCYNIALCEEALKNYHPKMQENVFKKWGNY